MQNDHTGRQGSDHGGKAAGCYEVSARNFGRNIRKIYMNRSYRNTVEIAEYANRLAGITGMELFERHGEPVREETFEVQKKALNEVL